MVVTKGSSLEGLLLRFFLYIYSSFRSSTVKMLESLHKRLLVSIFTSALLHPSVGLYQEGYATKTK